GRPRRGGNRCGARAVHLPRRRTAQVPRFVERRRVRGLGGGGKQTRLRHRRGGRGVQRHVPLERRGRGPAERAGCPDHELHDPAIGLLWRPAGLDACPDEYGLHRHHPAQQLRAERDGRSVRSVTEWSLPDGAGRDRGAPHPCASYPVTRSVMLLACLAGCFHTALVVPPAAVAVMPFDPYGGAIYVPAIVNGDSAWLMFETDTSATAVVRSLRLGDLQLDRYQTALYPLGGLSEASGRLQQGLVGHDVLHRFAVEIDYPTRRVRLLDAASFRYAGPGTAV